MVQELKGMTFTECLENIAANPNEHRILIGSKGNKVIMARRCSIGQIEYVFGNEADDTDFLVMTPGYRETVQGFDIVDFEKFMSRLPKGCGLSAENIDDYTMPVNFNFRGRNLVVKTFTPEFALFVRLDYAKIRDPLYEMQPGYIRGIVKSGIDYQKLAEICLMPRHLSPNTKASKPEIAALLEEILGEDASYAADNLRDEIRKDPNPMIGALVLNRLIDIFDKSLGHFNELYMQLKSYSPGKTLYQVTKAATLMNSMLLNHDAESVLNGFERIQQRYNSDEFDRITFFFNVFYNNPLLRQPSLDYKLRIVEKGVNFCKRFAAGLIDASNTSSCEFGQYVLEKYLSAAEQCIDALSLQRRAGLVRNLLSLLDSKYTDRQESVYENVDGAIKPDIANLGEDACKVAIKDLNYESVKKMIDKAFLTEVRYPFEFQRESHDKSDMIDSV